MCPWQPPPAGLHSGCLSLCQGRAVLPTQERGIYLGGNKHAPTAGSPGVRSEAERPSLSLELCCSPADTNTTHGRKLYPTWHRGCGWAPQKSWFRRVPSFHFRARGFKFCSWPWVRNAQRISLKALLKPTLGWPDRSQLLSKTDFCQVL